MSTKRTTRSTKSSKKPTTARKSNRSSFLSRFSQKQLTLVVFTLLFAAVGSYFIYRSFAAPSPVIVERFVNKPDKGLIWDDMFEPGPGSPCYVPGQGRGQGLLELKDKQTGESLGCTHGPDPAPEGVDVRQRVEPVKTGEADRMVGEGTVSGLTIAEASLVPCDGDGVSGKRVQALYVHAADVPSSYSAYAASFQTWAGNTNNVFAESAQQTGGARSVRFVTDANCNVVVTEVTIPLTGDDSFSNTTAELSKLGYNRADRKYLLWVDAGVYCGIGHFRGDDSPGSTNTNNVGPSYARVDSGCWGRANSTEAHELMHNLGGVQYTAPHTNKGAHCYDDYDRMCYYENNIAMTYPCPSTGERLFDCNKDDYYYAGTPPAGSYLATHWNTANSLFLILGSGSTPTSPQCSNGIDDDSDSKVDYPADPGCDSLTDTSEAPDPVNPPPADTAAPTVTISSPKEGSTIGSKVTISALGSDNVGVVRVQIYIDGVLKTTTTTSNTTYNWNSRKASKGTHTITVKAYDAAGNAGQSSVSVIK